MTGRDRAGGSGHGHPVCGNTDAARVDLDPRLRGCKFSLDEVAAIVAAAREISAGNLDAASRANGSLPTTAQEIGDLPLRVLPDGSTLRLEDVVQVTIASDPENSRLLFIGDNPAVEVSIERGISGDIIQIRNQAVALKDQFASTLPANIQIREWGKCR